LHDNTKIAVIPITNGGWEENALILLPQISFS